MHKLGYLHNDIKPENVLINTHSDKALTTFEEIDLILIDFGISHKFQDSKNIHCQDFFQAKQREFNFEGNLIFSSVNLFVPHSNFKTSLIFRTNKKR